MKELGSVPYRDVSGSVPYRDSLGKGRYWSASLRSLGTVVLGCPDTLVAALAAGRLVDRMHAVVDHMLVVVAAGTSCFGFVLGKEERKDRLESFSLGMRLDVLIRPWMVAMAYWQGCYSSTNQMTRNLHLHPNPIVSCIQSSYHLWR